jgi:hypothetical protein
VLIGPCNACANTRFLVGSFYMGGCSPDDVTACYNVVANYDMTTIAWGTTVNLNFGGCNSSSYTTSTSTDYNVAGGSYLVSPVPGIAFSLFYNQLCSGVWAPVAFIRSQQLVGNSGAWNLQTPPMAWVGGSGFPIPLPDSPCDYNAADSPPCTNGPGTLTCTDSTGPACVIDVPVPANWADVMTAASSPAPGTSFQPPKLICFNLIYSYLTLGSQCSDPP